MSRRKKIGAVVLAALIISVLFVAYQSRFARHYQGTGRGIECESISLINLIATPEKYDGKLIQVEGVCAFAFEGEALFLTRDDWKYGSTRNAVWANYDTLDTEPWDPRFMSKFHGRRVLVEGYFNSHHHGHLGAYSGAITNVIWIMTE
jgi:hypothetical protein